MSQILIVDDNEHIIRMFDEVLSSQGHKVFVANTGKRAMELIDNNKIDIAYVDLGLDDTSGLNILCYLKSKSPETVSTVISGESNIDYAINSLKTGAFRYLKKPFDIDSINEVTVQSIKEREKRIAKNKKINNSFQPEIFVKLISDLALLLPVMMLGFLIQQEVYNTLKIPSLWGPEEIIYILASFAFCYAFIFTSIYGETLRVKNTDVR
jgi:ActR/RegA family two-component response regulator